MYHFPSLFRLSILLSLLSLGVAAHQGKPLNQAGFRRQLGLNGTVVVSTMTPTLPAMSFPSSTLQPMMTASGLVASGMATAGTTGVVETGDPDATQVAATAASAVAGSSGSVQTSILPGGPQQAQSSLIVPGMVSATFSGVVQTGDIVATSSIAAAPDLMGSSTTTSVVPSTVIMTTSSAASNVPQPSAASNVPQPSVVSPTSTTSSISPPSQPAASPIAMSAVDTALTTITTSAAMASSNVGSVIPVVSVSTSPTTIVVVSTAGTLRLTMTTTTPVAISTTRYVPTSSIFSSASPQPAGVTTSDSVKIKGEAWWTSFVSFGCAAMLMIVA